jgi:HPt (histidine-containing phosphotransfer) domain-containing protein
LLTVFRSSLETHRARLLAARASGDVAEARAAAHALLGPSGYLRATELEECCRTLHGIGDADSDAWHRAVVAVDTCVNGVLHALADGDRPKGASGA